MQMTSHLHDTKQSHPSVGWLWYTRYHDKEGISRNERNGVLEGYKSGGILKGCQVHSNS